MTTKTHWRRLVNPDYIGAYSLDEGEDLTVKIDFVQAQEVTGEGGKKDVKSVMHLVNQKPMILNSTNSKAITKLYGPYIEDWRGKLITLYASTTKMAGEVVECLRVRPQVAQRKAQPITNARLDAAIKSIIEGTYKTDKLRANFALTEAQEAKLIAALAEHA